MNDAMFKRIRAACCEDHGLGHRNEAGKWVPRNSGEALDEHAAKIVLTILSRRNIRRGEAA